MSAPNLVPGSEAPPKRHRDCGTRTTHMFCRTWFFELLFTFFPCMLLALIIAGIYEFEETTRTFTTQQLYEHSMSPVTVALKAFLDRKLGTLDHMAAFVEGGGWSDVEDFDGVSAQIIPFFSRDEALRDGASGITVADEMEIGFVDESSQHLEFSTYDNPATANYVSQKLNRADAKTPSKTVRDRFVDFASFAPGLGLFSPNVSIVDAATQPWNPEGFGDASALYYFDNVGGVSTFGLRFNAPHPRVIVGSSLVDFAPTSAWFVTIDREEAFASVMPLCSTLVHAVIYDPVTFEIVFWNCNAENGNARLITEVGILNDALNSASQPTHVKITDIPGFRRVSKTGAAGVQPYKLGTIWFTRDGGAIANGESAWPSHDRLTKSIAQRAAGLNNVFDSISDFVGNRLITAETVVEMENFMAAVLGMTPFVGTVYQLLPYRGATRPMATFAVLASTPNSGGHRVFRHERFNPQGPTRAITTRFYASDRLDCSPEGLAGKSREEMQPCAARSLVENSTTAFLAGFGERELDYTYVGNLADYVPLWAARAANLTRENANLSQSVFVFTDDRDRGYLTLMREARLPAPAASAPWSAAFKPTSVYMRYSYAMRELQNTMVVLLGQYSGEGTMKIVDRNMNVIAAAGANSDDQDDVDNAVTGAIFRVLIEPKLIEPCTGSGTFFVCDVPSRTPLAYFYKVNHNPIRSSYVAFAKLVSHANTESWYTMQRLPGALQTTVTTTEKIVSGTAVFVAVLFLIVNAAYVAWATMSVTDLKRYMRDLARNKARDNLPLSSNTEIREIELALRKTKKAIAEYSRFLPAGLDRGQDLPDFDNTAEIVFNARLGKTGDDVFVTRQSKAAAEAAAQQQQRQEDANAGGVEMDERREDRPAADSVADTEAPATQPRTYDDMLLTHQVGVARREMAVLSLNVADVTKLARGSGANVLSALFARIAPVFHDAVRRGGGMMLPMGTGVGTLCAVWSASRTRSAHQLATVAAVTIGNALASKAGPLLMGRQPFSQISLAASFGEVDVGTVGDKDGRRTMLFVGECMDRVKGLHRAAGRKLRRVGCGRKDEKAVDGCAVACVCDAAFADNVPDAKAHILPGGSDGLWHFVSLRRVPKPGVQSGEPPVPEARLAEALRGTGSVRPDRSVLLALVAECTVPLIATASKPIAVIDHLA